MKSVLIVIMIFAATVANAWEEKVTHPTLSEKAGEKVFKSEFMKLDVNGKKAVNWIREGAELEDEGTKVQFLTGKARSLNHFHDPTKANLNEAGLNDLVHGISALVWAQSGRYQRDKGWENWSWDQVREYYYANVTADTEEKEEENLAKLLTGLGYQMHMIQDMSQPNHVRNDTHIADGGGWPLISGLETWVAAKDDLVRKEILNINPPQVTVDLTKALTTDFSVSSANTSIQTPKSPVAWLFDTRKSIDTATPSTSLSQGLSEYTNANFFSEDTVFAAERFSRGDPHYFAHPSKSETDVDAYTNGTLTTKEVDRGWKPKYWTYTISKKNTAGVKLDCIAMAGPNSKKYYRETGFSRRFYGSFQLDDECYKEHAKKLLPLSVGYSVALLEYFFRGDIDVTLPAAGVYSVAAEEGSFEEIRLNARNSTYTNEQMTNGEIKLAINYVPNSPDPDHPQPARRIVIPEKTGKRTIPSDSSVELVFDLSANPIPSDVAALEMRVVYRGALGNEADEIAVGYKDLSEPTPVDAYNNTDYVCLYDNWYRSGSAEALALTDPNHDEYADLSDIYEHNISNIAFQAGPAGTGSTLTATSTHNNLFSADPLVPGQKRTLGYILTDSTFRYTFDETWINQSDKDIWSAESSTRVFDGQAYINQGDYGVMYVIRGTPMWWGAGIVYDNPTYPPTSSCDWALLPTP